jgi:hypothetical protein
MKKSRILDISIDTQTGSAAVNGAAALPVRRACGGLLAKVGVSALLLGVSLLNAVGQPAQPQYQFTEIPLPGAGAAIGINDYELVTGYYLDPATGNYLSFRSIDDLVTTGLEAPGATDTLIGPANNLGVETGNYGDFTEQQAVLYDIRRGTYVSLPAIPNMPLNFGNGINDFGHVVGVAYAGGNVSASSGLGQNWIWDGKDYSFFTVPGSEVNGAYVIGINDWEQISGYYIDGQGTHHGFMKDGPNFTILDDPDAGLVGTIAGGINNLDVVAGTYEDANGFPHGFVWFRGSFVTVDVTINDAIATEWFGINDNGDLAGEFFDTSFVQHTVIAERLDEDRDWDH